MKLHPVTYNLNITGLNEKLNAGSDKGLSPIAKRSISEKEQLKYSGFVAQDVEKAAKELGYDFSGVDAPKNTNDLYSLRYADFVVPLVKAVQEQQVVIEKQNNELKMLKAQLEALTKAVQNLSANK